ncbi:MAG: hypothetical protein PQJ50_14470, partial [Spirochaetales bacterium]|nr:hypothetical protein [Spirochaetales bacterium]
NPLDITAISFLGDFNRFLPIKMQHKIMNKGKDKVPYMGFIVDPYCTFLAYEITDRETASKMLPEGYDLAETALFKGEKKRYLAILSVLTARTSAFAGVRLECYLIARSRETGLMSWIIADYVTNTNSHDPKNGFCGYSCDKSVFTTTPYGELLIDVAEKSGKSALAFTADLKKGKMTNLDQKLWVEGNMSIDYGGVLKDEGSVPFSLVFDPVLMKEASRIDVNQIKLEKNSFMSEIIDGEKPLNAAVFPYSQHFFICQDFKKQEVYTAADLKKQIDLFMNREGFKMMKGDDIKKPLFRGMLLSSLINAGIILILLWKLLF